MEAQEEEENDTGSELCTVADFSLGSLFWQLTNKHCLRKPTDQAITYLFNFLGHLKCAKMVIEREYVDRDYLDDYANYYVKCFEKYERFCKRIHFFTELGEHDLRDYYVGDRNVGELTKKLNQAYLGYAIVRPLPRAIIGRTVLRPWEGTLFSGEDEPTRRSIRCAKKYELNLVGIDLSVMGLAFQEQDTVLAACATSALWMAFQQTGHVFGHRIPTLFEITKGATRYLQRTRPIPSHGLAPIQMCQAITEVGLEAELRDVYIRKPKEEEEEEEEEAQWIYNYPLLAACYGYLRGGVPPILAALVKGQGEHAVTLVGYRIGDETPEVDEMRLWQPESEMKLKGSRIKSFYAHDDQIGPYSRLTVQAGEQIEGTEAFPLELGSDWRTVSGNPTTMVPQTIIFPLYPKIRVPFASPLRLAKRMQILLTGAMGEDHVEWDIFLSSVNEYKREVSNREDISQEVRKSILCLSHPRFFWRTRAFFDGDEICEMLVDATDMEMSFQLFSLNIFDDYLETEIQDIPDEFQIRLIEDPLGMGPLLLRFIDEHFGSEG